MRIILIHDAGDIRRLKLANPQILPAGTRQDREKKQKGKKRGTK